MPKLPYPKPPISADDLTALKSEIKNMDADTS
jgi:hypothetical protein